MEDIPEAVAPVWWNDQYMIQHTGYEAYQIYKRLEGTDNWERQPKGQVVWYKSLEAAKEALPNNDGPDSAAANDANPQ